MSNRHGAHFISFASPKGGVGKSTSCLAIAGALLAQGQKVRIIDFDQTETICRWYTDNPIARAITNLTVEKGPTGDHGTFINQLWAQATDYVLLDLAGSLSELTLMIAAFATLTITPAKVSEPDIIEANKMANKLHAVATRVGKPVNHRILLNELPNIVSRDEVDLIEQIDSSNLARFETIKRIEAEWTRALVANRPDLDPEHIARTAVLMNAVIPDALVEVDEEVLESIHLPDPDDRHVVAAALAVDAAVILTFNTSDFPEQDYNGKAVSPVHPDVFLSSLAAVFPERFVAAAAEIRARLKAPPVSVSQYLTGFAKLGLPNLAVVLSRHEDAL